MKFLQPEFVEYVKPKVVQACTTFEKLKAWHDSATQEQHSVERSNFYLQIAIEKGFETDYFMSKIQDNGNS